MYVCMYVRMYVCVSVCIEVLYPATKFTKLPHALLVYHLWGLHFFGLSAPAALLMDGL